MTGKFHRFPQALPVKINHCCAVKTLAIRSTSEEMMVARREALKRGLGVSGGKFPKLADDSTMRDFIAVCPFRYHTFHTFDLAFHLEPEIPLY